MPAIAPFRALRYNLARVGDLSLVVAPPYDVISPAQREQLAARSPHNIVHLELPTDQPPLDRYAVAAGTFRAWRASGVLARDPAPSLYLYEHAFEWQGRPYRRLGVVGLLELTDASIAQVLRHEATFEGPKTDRMKLMDAVQANLSPVFCVAPDASRALAQTLAACRDAAAPTAAAVMSEQDRARLWVVTDPARLAAVRDALRAETVLIADGHHRFAVAASRRAEHPSVMCFFACLEDPAVVMRPIHRVVQVPPAARLRWKAELQKFCAMEPAASAQELSGWLQGGANETRFGYYARGAYARLTLREPAKQQWLSGAAMARGLAGLDVTVLHQLLLPSILGAEARPSAGGERASGGNTLCDYTADADQAVAMADRLEGGCAWLLRPLPLSAVYDLARQGITLAQKTTYFYPKLLSGLFINSFRQD